MTRYAVSRKKACEPCSKARLKCIRNETGCRRCTARGLTCTYSLTYNTKDTSPSTFNSVQTVPSDQAAHTDIFRDGSIFSPSAQTSGIPQDLSIAASLPEQNDDLESFNAPFRRLETPSLQDHGAKNSRSTNLKSDGLSFSDLDLMCPIDADSIQNRWLNSYVPIPGQVAKNFPIGVGVFVQSMLKAYTTSAVRGRAFPPFVHPTQILKTSTCPILSTCFSLIKICQDPFPGTNQTALDILQREMDSIHKNCRNCDDMAILATFQAYLIYCMVMCFQLSQRQKSSLRQAVVNLQEIACFCSQQGLVSSAERQRTRPKWEAWIIAEAKRRTLYTMYLFDNMLSIQDGLPTFLATEVRGVPAPASKLLWQARTRKEWEESYNVHLVDWVEGDFLIDELWPVPVSFDTDAIMRRQDRQTHWLEMVDEFGVMIYSVTSGIHNG